MRISTHHLFALLLYLSPLLAQAQFFKDNTWWYNLYLAPGRETFTKMQIQQDTTVGGKLCKDLYLTNFEHYYCYEDSNRVYTWSNGQFYKLYDFNLVQGDTFSTLGGLQVHIDSVYQTTINGHSVPSQKVTAQSLAVDFSGTVIYSIGNLYSFVPSYDRLAPWPADLRCYHDSVYGQYTLRTLPNGDCEYVWNGIEQIDNAHSIRVTEQAISYQNTTTPKALLIYNTLGQLVTTHRLQIGEQYYQSKAELPAGLAIICLRDEESGSTLVQKISTTGER